MNAAGGDGLLARIARPQFLIVLSVIYLNAYVIYPWFNGGRVIDVSSVDWLASVFGGVYVVARSSEKISRTVKADPAKDK